MLYMLLISKEIGLKVKQKNGAVVPEYQDSITLKMKH